MSSEWKTYTLADVAFNGKEGLVDGPFGSALPADLYQSDGIPVIRGSNLSKGEVRFKGDDFVFVSKEVASRLARAACIPEDIVFTKKGTLGQVGIIPTGRYPAYLLSSNQMRLRVNKEVVLPDFAYYYLSQKESIEKIVRDSEHTGVPKINLAYLRSFPIVVPPISEQRHITTVLNILDDRIALLRETNATLEAMAQALFKSWFVDFDPVHANAGTRAATLPAELQALFPSTFTDTPQGLVPEGWRVVSFTETINVIGGGTPKTSIPEYWGGDIPWFSVVDAPATTDVFVISTEKQITELGLNNSSTKLLPAGTTIISARGTVGRLALVGCDMAMNQSCYGLRGKYGDDYFTYFTTCRLVEALKQRSHGSVFDTITRDTLAGVSVIYPDYSVVAAFEDAVSAVMEKIKNNLQKAQTLATLRDTLLPRLISGQLRLPDAEAALAEASA